VDIPWQGRGAAGTLMRAVEGAACGRNADTVWLGVWERNLRAQAFYRKHGFAVVGTQVFMMGRDPQRDFVMARPLAG
jgi:ribosomal protein S18 acetylase RimI-like enzyme